MVTRKRNTIVDAIQNDGFNGAKAQATPKVVRAPNINFAIVFTQLFLLHLINIKRNIMVEIIQNAVIIIYFLNL